MSDFKVLGRERLHDRWAKLDLVEVECGGKEMKRYVVEVGDAAGVLLHDVSRDRLLFVRQLRVALERHGDVFPLEIVAGKVDPGETALEAAIRETEEEAGYRVATLEKVAEFYASPGILSEMLTVYYATIAESLRVSDGGGDDTEDIEFVELTPAEAFHKMDMGEIRDAKTVVSLLWLRNRLS